MTFKKVILIGLIVIMLESIAGYIYLTYRNNSQPDVVQPKNSVSVLESQPEKKARLALQTDQVSLKKGEHITVYAHLDTFSNKTSAADLTIRYDPTALMMIATTSAKPFKDSEIYQKNVFNSLDSKAGIATMSAVSDENKLFSGEDFLTSMVFKALKVGPTEITIVFTPGETRDTNIVSETKDILESVENLPITILP